MASTRSGEIRCQTASTTRRRRATAGEPAAPEFAAVSCSETRQTAGGAPMTEHRIATQEEWQAERDELLRQEKELTRRGDELARKRRELPWVAVEKDYRFETEDGTKTLAELFDGRSQLLVYHFMFGPPYEAGCPVC